MKKLVGLPLLLALSMILVLALAGCGSAAEAPTEAPAPTAAPTATTAPTQAMSEPTATPQEQMSMSGDEELVAYAAKVAGGPGAIYVGDLSQLVGPAPEPSLGGIDEQGRTRRQRSLRIAGAAHLDLRISLLPGPAGKGEIA